MKYATVCSGIGAPEVAWGLLGWECAWQAEIEPFPSAVLAHHFPGVPNRGDVTRFREWPDGSAIELLCAGTPCPSFSVAGKRAGLDDPRGNLTLEFIRLALGLRPLWVVWENVPGVLSIDGGEAFAAIISGFTGEKYAVPRGGWKNAGIASGREGAYGIAWRVLDAQYFGVPQRRRRVFLVGYLGDWRPPCAVLFEPESLRGDPPPRREKGEEVAGSLGGGSGSRGWNNDLDRSGAYVTSGAGYWREGIGPLRGRSQDSNENLIAPTLTAPDPNAKPIAGKRQDGSRQDRIPLVFHSLRAEGFDASEDGSGRGTPIIPILEAGARQGTKADKRDGLGIGQPGDPMFTLSGKEHAIAFTLRGREGGAMPEVEKGGVAPSMRVSSGGGGQHTFIASFSVRRITPRECERLMGFPDDYTAIQFRGKPAADGPRYRALGNSMAVPVLVWLGKRIQQMEEICSSANHAP